MDSLRARYGATALAASGAAVGMPEGSVGNSEVGHLHLGAGRRVPSDRVRIDAALADGTLASNGPLLAAVRGSRDAGRALHLLGIVSFYSSHGSVRHLRAILGIARRERHPKVFVHALLGRRGERPEAGAGYVRDIERECARLGTGRVATVMGRFWALDREGNWDRVAKAYGALVRGEGRAVPPGGASRATGASQRAGEG
jgi:2,3-bisphosphoglycerate-independent phosphoglycerate mutase